MRPHAYIVLLLAVHARAATIQNPTAPELQKKLPEEPPKEASPLDNVSSEQELLDSANTIKDVENNLRVKAIDSIPVKVIVENADDDTSDVKRVEVDLEHPGEPQRQEHDTQSPVSYSHEQQIVSTVKQTISDTQSALKQGFQGVTQGLQDWIANNEQLNSIQQNIQGLQQSFTNQINKLNETLQSYLNNQGSANIVQSDNKNKPEFDNVENNLKSLEDNFKIGVKALSEGVQIFASLRDDEKPTPPPNNLFLQYLQLFQQTVSQGFSNVTQAIQSYVGQNNPNNTAANGGIFQGLNNGIQNIFSQGGSTAAPGAQSDEPVTQKPTIWQGIQSSIQNILNPGQNQASPSDQVGQAPSGPSGPIAQAIQNNPFVQGVVNLIQPNKPAAQQPQPEKPAAQQPKPEKPAAAAPPTPEGSNVVPAASSESKPDADQQQPAKATEQQAVPNNNGPIKNIIQNNPIVQGISGAVQRLQSSINGGNPEKPRDAVVGEQAVKSDDTQGKGHHGASATVTAWSNFVNSLIGTIAAAINGTAATVGSTVNGAINTLGTNIQVSRWTTGMCALCVLDGGSF
ncbi:unnamed protein product [Diatraea saccharalis]|uniref:Uncharacterized protein n=1 Tax=Diatraea saccharalis TaxID=40085 RepID=A0A9N9R2U8_9NEOP|nr:unnamed protein product [Diatraea saccharalis]